MEFWINGFYFFALTVVLLYALLLFFYSTGWIRTKTYAGKLTKPRTLVSIIIAARNEERFIAECLNHIIHQEYPKNLFEVIVADDNSSDATVKEVKTVQQLHPQIKIHLIKLQDAEGVIAFKKRAIATAIEQAKGSLIVTTDADCKMGNQWLSTLVSFYESQQPKMIVAPVCFDREKSLFEKIQSLEFSGLIAVSGASLYYNMPLMCNGANLAYEKQAFNAVGGFEGIDNIASGDDVLLMLKLSKRYPGEVKFLKSKEATVQTNAAPSLKAFIQQRKRWASKSFASNNCWIPGISILVFTTNFLIALTLLISAFSPKFAYLFLLLFGIKSLIDLLILSLATSFFNKRSLLGLFLPVQMLYVIYVITVGISGSTGKYKWKGRILNSILF